MQTEERNSKGWGSMGAIAPEYRISVLCGVCSRIQFVHTSAGASAVHETVEFRGQHWVSSSIALPFKSIFILCV